MASEHRDSVAEALAELHARRSGGSSAFGDKLTPRKRSAMYELQVDPLALSLYVLFLGAMTTVAIASRSSDEYHLGQMIRENLLGSEFDPADTEVAKFFGDVTSLADVWMYLRGPFAAIMYIEVGLDGLPLPPAGRHFLNEQLRILGPIRMVQVGVTVTDTWCRSTRPTTGGACRRTRCLMSPSIRRRSHEARSARRARCFCRRVSARCRRPPTARTKSTR